jgi:hypothetical protein
MSFFDLTNDKQIVKEEIVYDYRNVSIYGSDVSERTLDSKNKAGSVEETPIAGKRMATKDAYYRVSFPNKSPNLTYSKITPSSYTATNLYLFGLLHNNIKDISVSDDQVVGELVIEHATNQPPYNKTYTCFLLKRSSSAAKNSIDKLVELARGKGKGTGALDLDLNETIPAQTDCFYYNDSNNNVFLFTAPIEINAETADFVQSKLSVRTSFFKTFAPTNTTRIQIGTKPTPPVEGDTQEGMENNDVYIDCQPTGESDETIQAYSIPINSEYSGAKNTIDFMRSAINLLMFLVISVAAYFVLPPIYKKIVVDKINTLYPSRNDTTIRLTNISYADTSILLVLGGYILLSFVLGASSAVNIGFVYIGFVMSIITAAMASIIQVKKTDSKFMTTVVEGTPVSSFQADQSNKGNLDLFGVFKFILANVVLLASNSQHRNNFFVIWLLLFAVILIILKFMVFKALDSAYKKDRGEQTLSAWFIPMFLLNTFILAPTTFLTMY